MKKLFLTLGLAVVAVCAVSTLRADDTSTNSTPATTNTLATTTFTCLDTNAVAVSLDTNATLTAKN